MAYLSEEKKWEEGIYQYETSDPLQGGADGIDNVQGRQLANRTVYLKAKVESAQETVAAVEASATAVNAYAIGEQFVLNDTLYTATAAIAVGDTIAEGTNCKKSGSLVEQLKENKTGTEDAFATARADESKARNLLDVLGIRSVHSDDPATEAEAKACILEMHTRLEAGDTSWYRDCDYLDLSSLTVDGTTYTWDSSYKNLRLMNMGLNVYKHAGDTENTKNHVVMQFRNCVLSRQMNSSDTNTGGYPSSELRTWLNDKFKSGLVAALGDYLLTIRRLLSTKGGWNWYDDTAFLPTEREVWGAGVWGEADWDGGFQAQWPAYKDSTIYKVKRLNGSRMWWWEATPQKDNAVSFCYVYNSGTAHYSIASGGGGLSPAICVA